MIKNTCAGFKARVNTQLSGCVFILTRAKKKNNADSLSEREAVPKIV